MLATVTKSVIAATTFSLLGIGSLGFCDRAHAIGLNFSTFDVGGDATLDSPLQATIRSGSLSTLITDGGVGSLQEFLGLPAGAFDTLFPNNTFGSAIKKTVSGTVGDSFTFDFNFTQDTSSSPSGLDTAFVTINNDVFSLATATSTGKYTYTFTATGDINLGIGVLDIDDDLGASTLVVAVPFEFEATGGLLMLGGFFLGKHYLRKSKEK
ncbi:MAG: PEP-CTERM sorting domain-containing protein [Pseudanabaena sp.]|nr:MAG: PEP-CTERM sorting domain-containing protein [Pseudanabaena sp.]